MKRDLMDVFTYEKQNVLEEKGFFVQTFAPYITS